MTGKKQYKNITVSVEEEIYEKICKKADANGQTRKYIINEYLREGVENEGVE